MLEARARLSSRAELRPLAAVLDDRDLMHIEVELQAGAGASRLTLDDCVTLGLGADDDSLWEQVMNGLMLELLPYAATIGVDVELVTPE